MTIAFLFARAPEERDVLRFAIPSLAAEQPVHLLDFSCALGREQRSVRLANLPSDGHVQGVRSTEEFRQILLDFDVRMIIDILPPNRHRSLLLSVCHSAEVATVRHAIGPIPQLPKPSVGRFFQELTSRPPRRWVDFVESSVGRLRRNSVAPLQTFIGAGDASLRSAIAQRSLRVISGRSLDCDENERPSLLPDLPKRFAVYVDSGGPLHPDLKLLGLSSPNSANYFSELRNFLCITQDVMGIPVLVARHPRMSCNQSLDELSDFSIFDSATSELVRRSEIVLDNGSTATSFSVLNMKPIRYIAPGSQRGDYFWRLAHAFATALGQKVYNETKSFAQSLLEVGEVPIQNYADYRRMYLFSDNHTQRTFAQEILKIAPES